MAINTTVYPFGINGDLPSSIGIVDDVYTGGSDKALSAQQGKILKEEIDDFKEKVGDISYNRVTYTSGKAFYFSAVGDTVNTNGTTYSNAKCAIIEVSIGDKISAYVTQLSATYRGWGILDEDKKVIAVESYPKSPASYLWEYTVTNSNAKYIIINAMSSQADGVTGIKLANDFYEIKDKVNNMYTPTYINSNFVPKVSVSINEIKTAQI